MPRRPGGPAAGLLLLAALACGCDDRPLEPNGADFVQLRDEAERLRGEAAELRRQLAERDERIDTLTRLGDTRGGKLFRVQRIELGHATGGIDTDARAGDDAVKVTVKPIDQHGSVIKAPGEVTIQLYDLAAPRGRQLVGTCHFDVDQAAKCWSSGFLTYYYAFTCPWKSGPPEHDEITVRVEFLDYLTGKKRTAQKVVKVAAASTRPAT